MELLARKDKQIESHTTLEVSINTTSVVKNYYFASAELVLDGITWQPQLRKGSEIKASLTRAADQATVDLQNVDSELGKEFLTLGESLNGADAKLGRYWKDLESSAEYHHVMFAGVVVGVPIDENAATITMISEPYANISVGASRRVTTSCQWEFRNPLTCGYAGSLLTCNFQLNSTNGCEGRHGGGVGATLKRAKFGGFAFLSSASRLKRI